MASRNKISPSDLTFGLQGCPRCLWLKYQHSLTTPGFMPLVGDLADMQEKFYLDKATTDISTSLPSGRVIEHGGWVKSQPLNINGRETAFVISGKFDLLLEFEDGTFGIVDCKFSARASDKSEFYRPQLEAYAYALEHPHSGTARQVSHIGLLVWSLNSISDSPSVEVSVAWQPINRMPDTFKATLESMFSIIEGEMPPAQPECGYCTFVDKRRALGAI
jgi:hypothetical protein